MVDFVADAWPYLVGSGLVAGVLIPGVWRWLDRPRLRLHVRDEGYSRDGHQLTFEVANGGASAAALHPVVVIHAIPIFGTASFPQPLADVVSRWPKGLQRTTDRLVGGPWRAGHRLARARRIEYDILDGQDLRLEAQAGSRTFHALPRRPQEAGATIAYLRTIELRIEGRRRRHRHRLVGVPPRRVSTMAFVRERILFVMRGLPARERRFDTAEWEAARRSRG